MEFTDDSMQEFFAALHYHRLMLTGDGSEKDDVMSEILQVGSRTGRFLFGICSSERRQFQEMLEWLIQGRENTFI